MPIPEQVDAVERQFASDRLYAVLRDWIIDGTLRPNERVRDVDIAARFGVSRTPVREALQRLEGDGLVETAPNRWTKISAVNVDDAVSIYPVLGALEALAIRLADADIEPADLSELIDANERLARALHSNGAVRASEEDVSFHRVLIWRGRNAELTRILDDLKVRLRRIEIAYFNLSLVAERSVEEHKAIIDALERGDVEAAAHAVEQNWRGGLQRLLESHRLSSHSNRTTADVPHANRSQRDRSS